MVPNLKPNLLQPLIESVSAQDLKDEEMIKLPIHLHEHGDWQQAISASI